MLRLLSLALLWLSPAPLDDPLAKLARELQRLREHKLVLQGDVVNEMRALVADVRLVWSVDPTRAPDAALLLLDVMGYFLDASDEPSRRTPEAELRDAASEALVAHFDAPFARWMCVEVLVLPRTQPIERRLAVARLFERNSVPSVKLALLECAQEREPRMRRAALTALVGWSDEAVNALFLGELARSLKGELGAAGALAEKHFSTVRFGENARAAAQLGDLVKLGLVSDDWRIATRSILISAPLSNEAIVPFLIEALSTWKQRGLKEQQSLRIRFEIQRVLRERSGRAFGLDPEDWRAWWALVRSGKIRTGGPSNQGGIGESTEASFFGIRPATDRVVFVIDRSGSMALPFGLGTAGRGDRAHRRWDEAKNQLLGFLQALGPRTRFNVVLFHDFAEGWKNELVPATKDNLRSLREWLDFQKPNGGTQLRAGIDRALEIAPDGTVDLAKLETDTVIVLCDGETAEGPGWVDGFLLRVNAGARIVFHGVQIGSQGDETMSKLARGSRGDFARIDG